MVNDFVMRELILSNSHIYLMSPNASIQPYEQSLGVFAIYEDSIEPISLGHADPQVTEFKRGIFILDKNRMKHRKFLRYEHKNLVLFRDKERLNKILLGNHYYHELSNVIDLDMFQNALDEFNKNNYSIRLSIVSGEILLVKASEILRKLKNEKIKTNCDTE